MFNLFLLNLYKIFLYVSSVRELFFERLVFCFLELEKEVIEYILFIVCFW